MRRFSALVFAFCACNHAAPPATAAPPSATLPRPPHAAPALARNTTGLALEALTNPISAASVRLVAPKPNEQIAQDSALHYDASWLSERLDPDGLGLDIALDAFRPRRLPGSASSISLALLVPKDALLVPGEHWLFIAPVSASGLVPHSATDAIGAARAVRFWIGQAPPSPLSARGAVWLRKPEGTYNGASHERVLFDVQAFSAEGAPLGSSCRVQLSGPVHGELEQPGSFALLSLAGGDYEISAFAPGNATASTRFTVNPELGGPK